MSPSLGITRELHFWIATWGSHYASYLRRSVGSIVVWLLRRTTQSTRLTTSTWTTLAIRPFTEAIGEPFYGPSPKSSNFKLNFLMLDKFLLVECGIFQLLSHVNFTSGTGHPVFWCIYYNIIIIVYSPVIICCSPSFVIIIIVCSPVIILCSSSFVEGGCLIATYISSVCKDILLALVSIGHDTYLGGSSKRACTEHGLQFLFSRLVNSQNLKSTNAFGFRCH